MTDFTAHETPALAVAQAPEIPGYLQDTYAWAYLWPISVWLLDRPWVASAILWGNYRRLKQAAFSEVRPGQRVLQAWQELQSQMVLDPSTSSSLPNWR